MSVVPRSRWVMRGLLLFVLAFANLHDVWSPDVIPNALLPFTLVRSGDMNYDEFVTPGTGFILGTGAADLIDREAYFFRACGASTATEPPRAPRSRGGPPAPGPNDHVCSVFPPGMGLLAIPLFLPFVLVGANALDLGLLIRVGHVAAASYEVLATLLLWAVFRRFASERWALALVLLYFLGTSVRTVSSQALWQHAGVHLALAVALWLVLVERPLSSRRALAAGLALGLGSVVRQTTAIASPFLGAGRAGETVRLLAGTALGALPLLAFDALVLGDPFEQGYGAKPFDAGSVSGALGLLVSPSRGLLVYEPFVAFAFASLALLAPRRSLVERRLAALPLAWAAAFVLYAAYAEWWGGRVFGPRFLDDQAPLLFALLAWGAGRGLLARAWARALFWISAAWSLLIFNAAALVYDQSWDTVPVNVNDDPSRLFSWTDPQWLAVLRDVPSGGLRVAVAIALSLVALAFLARVEGLIGRRVVASAR
ncbi:MAG TPA: hypothetical protein VFC31_16065 [Candidatus Limnocylindria bacterium]|nr:hypothetical protein [Candidatus Limnocylindria bacterium]